LHVPAERSIDAVTPEPVHTGLLYRMPFVTISNTSLFGVPLGIARAAINELTEMAQSKTSMGATQPIRENVPIQIEVGRAEAILRSARAFVFEAIEALWKAGEIGEVTTRDRVLARIAGSHAAAAAVQVVDMMFAAGGGGGIYERGRLGRCWRDAHAMSHHGGLSAFQFQTGGRVMLGLDPGTQRY